MRSTPSGLTTITSRRVFVEALGVTVAVITLVQFAGTRRVIALWLIEQRW